MNILLTSAGRRGYLVKYFKEAIGNEREIHVANSSYHSAALKYGDQTVITPLIYEDNYIPFLQQYCQENHIDAIIPLFDIDLPVLSKNVQAFDQIGVRVVVSNEKMIDICNDKWETYKFLEENEIKTPKTFLTISDALDAVEQARISFPLIIKPRWGMGSISIFEADNKAELEIFYEKTKKNNSNTYLSYESNKNIQRSVIIQEKLNGQEFGLDIIHDLKGKYMNTVVKKKYAMRSGETDCAETVKNQELELLGKKISGITEHIGNLDVDAFMVNGVSYVLEMNARFGGGYPFSHHAGVNLPKAIVSWLKQEEVDPTILKAQIGVVGFKDIQIIGGSRNITTTQYVEEDISHRDYV